MYLRACAVGRPPSERVLRVGIPSFAGAQLSSREYVDFCNTVNKLMFFFLIFETFFCGEEKVP